VREISPIKLSWTVGLSLALLLVTAGSSSAAGFRESLGWQFRPPGGHRSS